MLSQRSCVPLAMASPPVLGLEKRGGDDSNRRGAAPLANPILGVEPQFSARAGFGAEASFCSGAPCPDIKLPNAMSMAGATATIDTLDSQFERGPHLRLQSRAGVVRQNSYPAIIKDPIARPARL
jgi:hypothetical protein